MTADKETVRVLVADDHEMVREGIRALLSVVPHIEIVGEARTGTEAVAAAADLQPDVVLMDLNMPELNGIEATRQIVRTSPHIAVLVLTMFHDDDSVFAAMRAGALGYILKGASRADLVRAIEAMSHGEALYSPAIAQRMLAYWANAANPRPQPFAELTHREREILDLMAAGLNNPTIAQRLFISSKTVRNNVSNIFNKLHVEDRAQAIIKARQGGLGG